MYKLNGYELSRSWFNFAFDNPEMVSPNHAAIFFFAIEHNNRLGGREKFGFPSQMTMDAIGIKNWRTYSKALNDLVDWGFITMIQKSTNQYSANIISLNSATVKNTKAPIKALDKAMLNHSQKHNQSIVSVDKQLNNLTTEQLNNINFAFSDLDKFLKWYSEEATRLTNKKYAVRVVGDEEKTIFAELNTKYSFEEFKTALNSFFSESSWHKTNELITPKSFLKIDNFNKYLNAKGGTNETLQERSVRLMKEEMNR
tara:strand:+ start:16782 stop:17549 length:768 start_codon:yes stop_codon:yes gene_type:complete